MINSLRIVSFVSLVERAPSRRYMRSCLLVSLGNLPTTGIKERQVSAEFSRHLVNFRQISWLTSVSVG
jgi:hypothetical protein